MTHHTFAFYGIQDRQQGHQPAYSHDHNLCLMADGRVQTYLHLERLTRRKHDNSLPAAFGPLLDSQQIHVPDAAEILSVNSFVGDSFVSACGRLRVERVGQAPIWALQPARAYMQHATWRGRTHPAWIVPHELAHVASVMPFYGPWPENALLVHFDGGASVSNFSAFHFKDGKISGIEAHWELAPLSKLFNDNALSFALLGAQPGDHLSVPGKLMGYAALGRENKPLAAFLEAHGWFAQHWGRMPEVVALLRAEFGYDQPHLDPHAPLMQDIAAAMQQAFEAGLLRRLEMLQARTGAEWLCYAGGCALNIKANAAIAASGLFRDVFIPPCCNDSGLSLGAAALRQWQLHGHVDIHSAYLHPPAPASRPGDGLLHIPALARAIAEGQIVGICVGAAEAGPRALGNRSLIARADRPDIARRLSMACKGREWYRPVAPLMRADEAKAATGLHRLPQASRHMLMDFDIPHASRPRMAGAVHADGTARIQVLHHRTDHPLLHDLLAYLAAQHGIVALLNTSFNAAGEPIVHTAQDALASARRMGIDAVLIHDEFIPNLHP